MLSIRINPESLQAHWQGLSKIFQSEQLERTSEKIAKNIRISENCKQKLVINQFLYDKLQLLFYSRAKMPRLYSFSHPILHFYRLCFVTFFLPRLIFWGFLLLSRPLYLDADSRFGSRFAILWSCIYTLHHVEFIKY